MRLLRSSSSLRLLAVAVTVAFAGCGGGHNSGTVGPIKTVTLSPSPTVSLVAGDVVQMSVAATDAAGQGVFNQTFTFASSNSAIQIATNGLLCAGTWDSLTAPVNCTPANAGAAGISSNLTATAQGVTSNVVMAFVHARVARLTVAANPAPASGCVSQTGTVTYQAQAFDAAGNDITSSIGTFTWQVANQNVGTPAAISTTAPTNTLTAKLPGLTTVVVSVNNVNAVNSLPTTFEECPVASITISPTPVNFAAVNNTQQMSASAVDSLGAAVSSPPVTWLSNAPAVAGMSSSGVFTAVAPGTAGALASCTPNFCNIGLNEQVYSNLAIGIVPGTTSASVYAASSMSTSLIPINSNNSAGTAITLPAMPNSFVFDRLGDKAFLGSASGLMVLNPANNTVAAPIAGAPGRVIALSPDGNTAVVSNGTNVFSFTTSTGAVTTLNITNASGADFTPDGVKAFITAGNQLFIVQSGTALTSVALGAATAAPAAAGPQQSLAMLASGQAGYAAASGVPFFPACAVTPVGSADSGKAPTLVAALPDGSGMVAADGAASALDFVQVAVAVNPAASTNPAAVCSPSITNTPSQTMLGAAFTPAQIIVTPDAKHVYVTSNLAGNLLRDDIGGAATPIALVTTSMTPPTTFTGDSTADSATIYVGASDGQVHVIDVASGTDKVQIPLPSGFTPDLVAIKP